MSIEIPEYLKSGPLYEAAKKSLADAASMASSSNSVPRISLRGLEFRLVENGEEVRKIRDSMDFIILGVEPEAGRMIKTFYSKGYQSGVKEPPSCSSDNGISPSPWVTEKQSQTCATCPKNVFGSATSPNGKATKACRDSKRVWLVMADDPKPIAERTMYGLNVTVASLKSFSEHGRKLSGMGVAPAVAVTRAIMLDMEFPQLDFQLQGWVPQDQVPESLELSTKRPWKIFANAGLALSMGDSTPSTAALPSSLPGQSRPLPPNVSEATEVRPPSKPIGNMDEEIGKW